MSSVRCSYVFIYSEIFLPRRLERRFDLYHYQGIARYIGAAELDIKLTIGKCLRLNKYVHPFFDDLFH